MPKLQDSPEQNQFLSNAHKAEDWRLIRHTSNSPHIRSRISLTLRNRIPLLRTKEDKQRHAIREQGKKTWLNLHALEEYQPLFEESGLGLGLPSLVAKQEVQRIFDIYNALGYDQDNPGLYRHLRATASIAHRLAEQVSNSQTESSLGNCYDLEAMGAVRNIATFWGENEYFRKGLVVREACKRLGIHPTFHEYLLPQKAYFGLPLGEGVEDHCGQIYRSLTLPQKILELAGFLAKFDEEGRLLLFHEIIEREHENAEKRIPTPLWKSSQAAVDTVSPAFVRQWSEIYKSIQLDFTTVFGVNFLDLRKQVSQDMGLEVRPSQTTL